MAPRAGKRTLAVFGLLGLWPGLGGDQGAHEAVRQGNALYQAGEYAAAAESYRVAAAALPDAPEIPFNQGDAAFKQFEYDEAFEYYLAALDDTQNATLASLTHYNLANVRLKQAMQAMQTFQDALAPVRAAIDFYRDSLALDSERVEARYNLELAYLLLDAIEAQQVQGQRNAETRNQKTSDNQGQPFHERAQAQQAKPRAAQPDEQRQAQGQQASQAPPTDASTSSAHQIQAASTPQDLTPEQAEAFLDAFRERSQASQSLRQDARRARLREAGLARSW